MAIKLPYQQTDDRQFNQYQQALQASLAPILDLPTTNSSILTNVSLVAGDNAINHKLNRKLLGWYIVRQRAQSMLFDKQDSNPMPAQTLILNSSAGTTASPVIVDIIVF